MSLWLNSGVPATEVARRAGHGVAVLLKIYAHCIDGQADAANQRITDALDLDPDVEPGDGEGESILASGDLPAGRRSRGRPPRDIWTSELRNIDPPPGQAGGSFMPGPLVRRRGSA